MHDSLFNYRLTMYLFFLFLIVLIDPLQPKDRACCVRVPHPVRQCKGNPPANVPPGWWIPPGPPAARVSACCPVSSDEPALSFVSHGSPAGRDEQGSLPGNAKTRTKVPQAQCFGVSQVYKLKQNVEFSGSESKL